MSPVDSDARDVRILLVDDESFTRTVIVAQLHKLGYRAIDEAGSGAAALAALERARYHVVLLDLGLGDMTGAQILEGLRDAGRLVDLSVLMISSNADEEETLRCIELGADDYLHKPVERRLLRARLSACVGKALLRARMRAELSRLERELDAARKLQDSMMRMTLPPPSAGFPVEAAARMVSARAIGGDFYDAFTKRGDVVCFMVGDVSGKGIPAALFMARTKSLVRAAIDYSVVTGSGEIDPADVLREVNAELCRDNDEFMFVTLLLGVISTEDMTLRFCNAGHLSPFVLSAGGGADALRTLEGGRGRALGAVASSAYVGDTVPLAAGDAVFVLSDGVTDALDAAGAAFGDDRVEARLRALAGLPAAAVVGGLLDDLAAFVGDVPQFDDITTLCLRIAPEAAAPIKP